MDSSQLYSLINTQMSLNEGIARSIKALHKADVIRTPTLAEAEKYIADHGATSLIKGIVYISHPDGKLEARYDLPAAITALNILIQDIPSRDFVADQLSKVDSFVLIQKYRERAVEFFDVQLSFSAPQIPKSNSSEAGCDHDH